MEDPVFKKAIVKSIIAHFKGDTASELAKASKKSKYNKKYFEKMEMEFLGTLTEHDVGY